MLLLTWHGTLVCQRADGGLVHLPLGLAAVATAWDLTADVLDGGTPGVDGIVAQRADGLPGIGVLRGGAFLSADRDVPALHFAEVPRSLRESFLPVSAADVADLADSLGARWIVQATGRVISRMSVAISDGFRMRIGHLEVDLATGLPLRPYPAATEAAAPRSRLDIASDTGVIALTRAEPRSSALVATDRWPVRARRAAEMMTLAVHRQVGGQEPAQAVFERDTRYLMDNQGAAALEDLIESVRGDPAIAADPATPGHVLRGWAMQQIAPWWRAPIPQAEAFVAFDALNRTAGWAALYHFEAGEVSLADKPAGLAQIAAQAERAQHYLRFFRSLAHRLPVGFRTRLCLGLSDKLPGRHGLKLFCFQKVAGASSLLLPDIDFLVHDFYRDAVTADRVTYAQKVPKAVFSGSTTGGIITAEVARDLSLPRLRAAHYFAGSADVDFRLPNIVQCDSAETEVLLREHNFCRKPALFWDDHNKYRFHLSMDGNGAACARVVMSLLSRSVLLKYESENTLFYFGGLQPWVHYVPVRDDADVGRILELERRQPDVFQRIAQTGQTFARTLLTRDAAEAYTAWLLEMYADSFTGRQPAPPSAPRRSTAPQIDAPFMTAHVRQRGDLLTADDGWVGERGSGLWIEGFSIAFGAGVDEAGIATRALLADGVLSDAARAGQFVGTRGKSTPVFGLRIDASDAALQSVGIDCWASFIDGSVAGPIPAGTICRSETGAALEAFRVRVVRKA